MDPMQQQPSPVDGFASTLSSTNQEVNANQEVKSLQRVSLPLLLATGASEEAVRLSQLDDLGMSYNVCINLMHRTFSELGLAQQ